VNWTGTAPAAREEEEEEEEETSADGGKVAEAGAVKSRAGAEGRKEDGLEGKFFSTNFFSFVSVSFCFPPVSVTRRKGGETSDEEEDEASLAAARLDFILARWLANATPSSKSSEIRNEEDG
jgi:hypothetical protein